MPLSMKIHIHWMNLMKNQVIQKKFSFEILKEGVARRKQLCSTGEQNV
jgi:hypothetical protein